MNPEAVKLLAPSSRGIAGGMICAVWSAVVLLYAADYIFMRIPILGEMARPYYGPMIPNRALYYYGPQVWWGMAALSALSLVVAFRNPSRRAWVAYNVCVLVASVGLAFLARQAAFTALDGIGTGRT